MANPKQSGSSHQEVTEEGHGPSASGQSSEEKTSFVKAIIQYPWVVLFSIPAHASSLLWGFDIGQSPRPPTEFDALD